MEETTIHKFQRAMSHPVGRLLPNPFSMLANPFTAMQIEATFITLRKILSNPKCKMSSLEQLKPGDHIILRPKKADLIDRMVMGHHAIVQSVNIEKSNLTIIHYYSNIFKKHTDSPRLHVLSLVRGKVIKSKISFDEDYDIYKVTYAKSSRVKCVLQRAQSRLGETEFNFFLNNDEHFAYFCKTGTPKSCRNKMYVLKMAQVTVKLFSLGQSIFLVLAVNSRISTYFYQGATRVKTLLKRDTVIRAKETSVAGVFYGFVNKWLLGMSCSNMTGGKDLNDIIEELDKKDMTRALYPPDRAKAREVKRQKKRNRTNDRMKAAELGSQLVVRAVGQSLARESSEHFAKEILKKSAKMASKRLNEHIGKGAMHHVAKGAAVKSAVASASKSSGHGVAGAFRAAARGQGLAIGLGALVSVGFATKDIMKAKNKKAGGEISGNEYNQVVTRKVAGATTDIALGTYGAVMGTLLGGPLGAVVGGFMGSMVGSIVGEEIGEELNKNEMGIKWAEEGNRIPDNDIESKSKTNQSIDENDTFACQSEFLVKDGNMECIQQENSKDAYVPGDTGEISLPNMCEVQETMEYENQECSLGDEEYQKANTEYMETKETEKQQLKELFGEYFNVTYGRKESLENGQTSESAQSTANESEMKEPYLEASVVGVLENDRPEGHTLPFSGFWGSLFGNLEDKDAESAVDDKSADDNKIDVYTQNMEKEADREASHMDKKPVRESIKESGENERKLAPTEEKKDEATSATKGFWGIKSLGASNLGKMVGNFLDEMLKDDIDQNDNTSSSQKTQDTFQVNSSLPEQSMTFREATETNSKSEVDLVKDDTDVESNGVAEVVTSDSDDEENVKTTNCCEANLVDTEPKFIHVESANKNNLVADAVINQDKGKYMSHIVTNLSSLEKKSQNNGIENTPSHSDSKRDSIVGGFVSSTNMTITEDMSDPSVNYAHKCDNDRNFTDAMDIATSTMGANMSAEFKQDGHNVDNDKNVKDAMDITKSTMEENISEADRESNDPSKKENMLANKIEKHVHKKDEDSGEHFNASKFPSQQYEENTQIHETIHSTSEKLSEYTQINDINDTVKASHMDRKTVKESIMETGRNEGKLAPVEVQEKNDKAKSATKSFWGIKGLGTTNLGKMVGNFLGEMLRDDIDQNDNTSSRQKTQDTFQDNSSLLDQSMTFKKASETNSNSTIDKVSDDTNVESNGVTEAVTSDGDDEECSTPASNEGNVKITNFCEANLVDTEPKVNNADSAKDNNLVAEAVINQDKGKCLSHTVANLSLKKENDRVEILHEQSDNACQTGSDYICNVPYPQEHEQACQLLKGKVCLSNTPDNGSERYVATDDIVSESLTVYSVAKPEEKAINSTAETFLGNALAQGKSVFEDVKMDSNDLL